MIGQAGPKSFLGIEEKSGLTICLDHGFFGRSKAAVYSETQLDTRVAAVVRTQMESRGQSFAWQNYSKPLVAVAIRDGQALAAAWASEIRWTHGEHGMNLGFAESDSVRGLGISKLLCCAAALALEKTADRSLWGNVNIHCGINNASDQDLATAMCFCLDTPSGPGLRLTQNSTDFFQLSAIEWVRRMGQVEDRRINSISKARKPKAPGTPESRSSVALPTRERERG